VDLSEDGTVFPRGHWATARDERQFYGSPQAKTTDGNFGWPSNKPGASGLTVMPENKPTTGPMTTQPVRSPVIPETSSVGKLTREPRPAQKFAKTQAISAEKAKTTRLDSLRKQRAALKEE
jgi:hypothetical protein